MTRLLVVEDSRAMAMLLQALFEMEGHRVAAVTTCFSALVHPACPLWDEIDMLVTDLDLGDPEVDGLDLIEFAHHRYPEVRRGLLSGNVGGERYLAAARSADVIMPKPTNIDDLLLAVQ